MYVVDAVRIGKKNAHAARIDGECIISAQDPFESGLVGYLISKKYNVPFQVQVHTDIGNVFFRTQSVLNRIRLFIARFVLKQARSIRVVSPSTKTYLVAKYGVAPERITVLPIVGNFKPEERRESAKRYVLVVSRLEKEKHVDRALHIFKEVLGEKPDLVLKIAGNGREEARLKHIAKKLGIESNVVFLGNVKDVAPLYAQASCLLHTSLYEGFGMVLYEAMMSGCPIVSTPVGIAPDLKKQGYEISVCDLDDRICMHHALMAGTGSFIVGKPVELTFVPRSYEEYLYRYRESLTSALRARS